MTDIPLLNGVIFAALGIALFAFAFAILSKAAPFDLWKEIAQEHNVAAAILAALSRIRLACISSSVTPRS